MSSCQDSMDTDDTIPRPEYEDIVADEDDDDEFWAEKPISNSTLRNNGTTQETQINSSKDAEEQDMEEDSDYEEVSFDEVDDEDEEIINKIENTSTSLIDEDKPAKLTDEHVNSTNPASTTTVIGNTEVLHSPKSNNHILPTVENQNDKGDEPQPPTVDTEVIRKSSTSSKEEKEENPSSSNEAKSLIACKDDGPRSSTPSNRGTREYLALQKSFTESKVLSEFVSEKDRSRKVRKHPLKSEDFTSANDANFRICRARSKSCSKSVSNRQMSQMNNSVPQRWPSSEKLNYKRENMRSQNTDFVEKQMKFLNRVNHSAVTEDPVSDASDDEQSINESHKSLENKEFCWQPPPKKGSDSFCWKCRKCTGLLPCSKCPRSFHYKCVKVNATTRLDRSWICPECIHLESCINGSKKSKNEELPADMLNQLLLFAFNRMKQVRGNKKLLQKPDESQNPLFSKYVVNPVTLNSIQEKIEKKVFRCTEELVLETKWIQHNASIACTVYNSKDVLVAKNLLKVCRQETAEIETCPECYLNANTRKKWFVDVCRRPHILLWAKLKGFPYWPAKGMGLSQHSLVNVRFFGAHDRSFVPIKDCYLYSEEDPNPQLSKRSQRTSIVECIKEVNVYIENIKSKVGAFQFARARKHYDPSNEMAQLEEMMPGVTDYIKRHQALVKPPLTYKIVKTADNHLSIIKKPDSGTDSDHSSLEADKIQRKSRAISIEPPKPSPLSEVKKAKESHPTPSEEQIAPTKSQPVVRSIPNKSLSQNYEVVAKPANKDESKINSVILKRKSEAVLTPPSVKKSKSSEEEEEVKSSSQSISSTSTSSSPTKREVKTDESKEIANSAKRMRNSRSIGRTDVTPLPQSLAIVKTVTSENEKDKKEQKSPPLAESNTEVPSTSQAFKVSSNAMVKFMQIRQGVTIRKLPRTQSGVNKYFANEVKDAMVKSHDRMDTDGKSIAQEKSPLSMVKQSLLPPARPISLPPIPLPPIPLPPIPPKETVKNPTPPRSKYVAGPSKVIPSSSKTTPIAIAPKPAPVAIAPKTALVQIAPKPKPTTSTNYPTKQLSKTTAPPKAVQTKNTNPKDVIPFNIKLEEPDNDVVITTPAKKSSYPLFPTTTNMNSKAAPSFSPNESPGSANSEASAQHFPVDIDLIKHETISDDDSSTPSNTMLEASTSITNQPTTRIMEVPTLVGDTKIQRIVVRSLESLQPAKALSAPVSSPTPSSSPAITPAQPKKGNARARKSFPNKGPNPSTVQLPPDVKRSLNKNSMVYIPVDSQNNVPIEPLTAVSKPVGNQSAATKTTSTLSIPTSSTASTTVIINSAAKTTTSQATTITSSGLMMPPPTPTSQSQFDKVASAIIDSAKSLISSFVDTPGENSPRAPGHIASLKTLSPLQLLAERVSTSGSQTSTTSDTESTSEQQNNYSEGEGHILSGIVTPSLAAAITQTIVRGPPKLTHRPKGALRSNGSFVFNSNAGPVAMALVEGAHKMTDFFTSVIRDTISDMGSAGIMEAKIRDLQLELELKQSAYEKQLYELKQNTDSMLCEMKKSMEMESVRLVAETRKKCEIERMHAVEQTKKKQWCTHCSREANCYCCWNTSYCDSTCQGMDWTRHKPHCSQINVQQNIEQQGPGVLFPAPSAVHPTVSSSSPGFMPPHQPQLLRPAQPTSSLSSASSTGTTSTATSSAATHPKKGGSPATQPSNTSSTTDLAYKSQETLKLPPNTYLRPLAQTLQLTPAQVIPRFNIPHPITAAAAAAATGGSSYQLVNRDNSWELMSTTLPSSTAVSSYMQTPRLVTVATNIPPDGRQPRTVLLRPTQM